VSKYLANAGNVHFWAIEMGTNDAWDKLNVSTYKSNLQRVIDSCKAHQIEPIIARMIATNEAKAGWQVNPDYLTAIDDLTSKNKLIPGPDFYNYFLQHPSELSSTDGVHPNGVIGAASMQRLWAEKMDSVVYQKTSAIIANQPIQKLTSFSAFLQNKRIVLKADTPGKVSIFSINGELLEKIEMAKAGSYTLKKVPRFCLIRFRSSKGIEKVKIVNYRADNVLQRNK
jgi:hypothetical protein